MPVGQPPRARGTLRFLAATQADRFDHERDAEPGKIVHEMRDGEMAALARDAVRALLRQRRFHAALRGAGGRLLRLAAGDLESSGELWPNIERGAGAGSSATAISIGDGFVEYGRKSQNGLLNQGWKDSHDSIFHADGTLAEPPIALCEVQGYAYAAWGGAARLAPGSRSQTSAPKSWRRRPSSCGSRFEEAFWCEDLGTYALALDGRQAAVPRAIVQRRPCLFTGIARPSAPAASRELCSARELFSGWGIRTIAAAKPATTRCPTTTARSGRTTTR